MAGASIDIIIDASILLHELTRIEGRLDDMTVAMNDIGEYVAGSTKDRFFEGKGPDGVSWVPLNLLYAETKANSNPAFDHILMFKGDLRSDIAFVASRDSVEVGSNEEYAAIHQFGGTIRPKNKQALHFTMGFGEDGKPLEWTVSSVTIPARPYLGLSQEDEDEVLSILREYLIAD